MKVLYSPTPMDGVFGPFVPLGKALLDAGHNVVRTRRDAAVGEEIQARRGLRLTWPTRCPASWSRRCSSAPCKPS
jgi:hypothetical protein